MTRALQLAARGVGDTSPNPAVGAVIVRGGRVVGAGYHRRAGLPHAEVEALRQAGARAKGATLYVTLEPCAHVGRTPPCCDAILRSGLRRVVAAMADPNPIVNGRGFARLRRAGVTVITGVLQPEAQRVNAPFTTSITKRRPWVLAKIAQSLDGKIATTAGTSRWISSKASRRLVHRLRREADVVMVGVNTVLADDPLLTPREAGRPPRPGRPIRVIVDSRLRMPLSSRCLTQTRRAPTVIATTSASASKRQALERRGAVVLRLPSRRGRVPLARLLQALAARYEATSVLLEGGGELLAGALEERVVDRLMVITAPIIIGGRRTSSSVGGAGIRDLAKAAALSDMQITRASRDVIVQGNVVYPS